MILVKVETQNNMISPIYYLIATGVSKGFIELNEYFWAKFLVF